ncbi:hypothetical protein COU01_02365 [Candidatus Falkowbacteria bacterium CG10_big_fil_rev_8_21_14_0_10_44_15]|uniref:Uncharacterized protein n=1 Tax=Candidatus Falkowbacteria bacterium CG10_big_fil_rev_8_21_14_0_10_44_15 TaxID=1974569 RepID=A0A2H0UZV0_9BACT|nr:MAG: hypothetical protein COU01_02365 [Candidatus Falkowbacteria bacterium CG10_big_fil_rev_8_21_14_0_10_44_15]
MAAKVIYAKNIEELPTSDLKQVGTVKLGEEKLAGAKLKQRLAREVSGGKTLTALEKDLQKQGLAGAQQRKRRALMDVIGGEENKTGKKKPVPWYRRALATEEDDISQKTGVSIHEVRGGVSHVSVDTRAQGGRMRSRINPLSGAASPAINGGSKSTPPKSNRPPLAR